MLIWANSVILLVRKLKPKEVKYLSKVAQLLGKGRDWNLGYSHAKFSTISIIQQR